MVVTKRKLDTPMMDIVQLIINIEGQTRSLFYTTRERVNTREECSLHTRERATIQKAGHA